MLGLILGFMAYDTAKTGSNKRAEDEKRKEIDQLRFRLKRPMTRTHSQQCVCRLCVNRREAAINRLNELLGCK